jgi:hypothetical protein
MSKTPPRVLWVEAKQWSAAIIKARKMYTTLSKLINDWLDELIAEDESRVP